LVAGVLYKRATTSGSFFYYPENFLLWNRWTNGFLRKDAGFSTDGVKVFGRIWTNCFSGFRMFGFQWIGLGLDRIRIRVGFSSVQD